MRCHVAVAETLDSVLATQHGMEKLLLFGIQKIEAASAAAFELGPATSTVQVFVVGDGKVHNRQSIQVALIAGQSHGVILIKVGHAFVHRTPNHLLASLSHSLTADTKFPRLVDNRFDPKDKAEFVIHLQPVVFHAVLDSGAGPAIFLAIAQDFPVKAGMQAATEKSEYILSGKVERRVIEQTRIEFCQRRSAVENDVRAVFGLIDDPMVVPSFPSRIGPAAG